MRDTRRVAHSPDLGAGLAVAAGCDVFPVRADGNGPDVVERPELKRALGRVDVGSVGAGQSHDPTRPILGDLLGSRRQGQRVRRTDAEFTPVGVESNRPPPHADRPAGQQVAGSFEHQVSALPIVRKASSAPLAMSQSTTPRLVPRASTRPSCRIATPHNELVTGSRAQSPILKGRLDLVGRQLVAEREDDSPVMAEVTIDHGLAGFAQPGPAQDRVPEPQSRLPAVAGQQGAGRVEARAHAAVGMALESRPPNARGGVPEVNLTIVARRRQRGAVGTPGDRAVPRNGIDRTIRPVSASRIRQWAPAPGYRWPRSGCPSGLKARISGPACAIAARADPSPGRR